MQCKITASTYKLVINPLKAWNSSNIWENSERIKILFMKKIRCRLKSWNAYIYYYYYSVKKLLFSSFLSENIKIGIYRTIILPFVLHRCETWSPTVSEGLRLSVFENGVLKEIFGPTMDLVMWEWGR